MHITDIKVSFATAVPAYDNEIEQVSEAGRGETVQLHDDIATDGRPAEDRKALEALHRGVPKTRMLDYGMHGHDAAELDGLNFGTLSWDDAAERLAATREVLADDGIAQRRFAGAAQQMEWGGAALTVGQLAFNYDTPRKRALLGRANALYARGAESSGAAHRRLVMSDDTGRELFGWTFPVRAARGCVMILGGLSGWGAAYFAMARAFNARGLAALIVEGPGQGASRLESKIFLSRAALADIARFVGRGMVLGGGRVGIIGNSFGGLMAAHVAAADDRIRACCINGAVPKFVVPEFRTAREQMEAAFGAEGPALDRLVADFNFDPVATPIPARLLVVEGGADPLVPLGAQAGFAGDGAHGCDVLTWADGEHTIYNHAADRNALVGAWFVDQLGDGQAC